MKHKTKRMTGMTLKTRYRRLDPSPLPFLLSRRSYPSPSHSPGLGPDDPPHTTNLDERPLENVHDLGRVLPRDRIRQEGVQGREVRVELVRGRKKTEGESALGRPDGAERGLQAGN